MFCILICRPIHMANSFPGCRSKLRNVVIANLGSFASSRDKGNFGGGVLPFGIYRNIVELHLALLVGDIAILVGNQGRGQGDAVNSVFVSHCCINLFF